DEAGDAALRRAQVAALHARPSGNARELLGRLLGPERRPERIEGLERTAERLTSGAAALRATLDRPLHEQRPAQLEGLPEPVAGRERPAGEREGAVAVAGRRSEERPRPQGDDLVPRPRGKPSLLLHALDRRLGLARAAER